MLIWLRACLESKRWIDGVEFGAWWRLDWDFVCRYRFVASQVREPRLCAEVFAIVWHGVSAQHSSVVTDSVSLVRSWFTLATCAMVPLGTLLVYTSVVHMGPGLENLSLGRLRPGN